MPLSQTEIQRITETIEMLERVRDNTLNAGGGHLMSDDIFDAIDALYAKLQEALGHPPT